MTDYSHDSAWQNERYSYTKSTANTVKELKASGSITAGTSYSSSVSDVTTWSMAVFIVRCSAASSSNLAVTVQWSDDDSTYSDVDSLTVGTVTATGYKILAVRAPMMGRYARLKFVQSGTSCTVEAEVWAIGYNTFVA